MLFSGKAEERQTEQQQDRDCEGVARACESEASIHFRRISLLVKISVINASSNED